MLFNSIEYLVFLPLAFIFYWFILNKNLKSQNFFLLVISYVFYGWWNWKFLSLIAFSSLIDFLCGLKIAKSKNKKTRKSWLILSIFVNLGFLGIFKYYNFFTQSLVDAFQIIGWQFDTITLSVILPVGISFYTFQTMSYTIDVYRRKLKPTKDIIAFFSFVSFFPQLVAGPIERASHLLPQFYKKRSFSYEIAAQGLRQILWGLFKKMVIADNCAIITNKIFNNYESLDSISLILGSVYFAFQIYGDFSGYSDIAIGTSKLFGFNLMTNFKTPYFSRDIAEFWRRWHISLTTWFRDYIYIPLGGSRKGKWFSLRNIIIIFLISGLWHGANWTFILWGGLNALYFIPLLLFNKNRTHTGNIAEGKLLPSFKDIIQIVMTFSITCFAWVFFRAENLNQAFNYIKNIFFNSKSISNSNIVIDFEVLALLIIMITLDWVYREKEILSTKNATLRRLIYIVISFCICAFSVPSQKFIYFDF